MASNIVEYVCGFLFSDDGTKVALIKKTHPDWMKDKFNGIGGRFDYSELAKEAMAREFKEETGVDVSANKWTLFALQTNDEKSSDVEEGFIRHRVFFFYCFDSDLLIKVHQMPSPTEEKVYVFYSEDLYHCYTSFGMATPEHTTPLKSITWLIPMALVFHNSPKPHVRYDISLLPQGA